MMANKLLIKIKNNGLYVSLLITIIFFCGKVQTPIQNEVIAARDVSSQGESWDRLLIEEVPSLKENVDNIINALNEGNHSMAGEQIDDIQTGDNWFNIRNELESRQATDLVSRFNNSLFELDRLSELEDSLAPALEQAQILSENMDDIVNKLSNPVVDIQRLVLTTSVIGIVIGFGLFIIPRVRKRFNIRY
jgi:hypothetical protein